MIKVCFISDTKVHFFSRSDIFLAQFNFSGGYHLLYLSLEAWHSDDLGKSEGLFSIII